MTENGMRDERELSLGKVDIGDPDNKQILLEQYKVFVDTMEKALARRQTVNSFFLTANSLLLSASGVMAKQTFESILALIVVLSLATTGILLCVSWRRIIRNYRQLNAAKFDVIHRLEAYLPVALFEAEWTALGRGEDPRKYQSISRTESAVAAVFIILYTIAIASSTVVLLICAGQGKI